MKPETIPPLPPHRLATVIELAEVLGIDKRRVQQLVNEGVLKKLARGRYDLGECVKAFAVWKAEAAANAKIKRETGNSGSDEDGDSDTSRKLHADANAAEYKAELLRLRVEEEQNRLIPAEQVADAWGKVLSVTKAKLLSIPSACAPEIQSLQTVGEIEAYIRAAVVDALSTLADISTELAAAAAEANAQSTRSDNS